MVSGGDLDLASIKILFLKNTIDDFNEDYIGKSVRVLEEGAKDHNGRNKNSRKLHH